MSLLAAHTFERLEQGIGKEQAKALLMKIIIDTVCELLPCTQPVQQQTEMLACTCAKVANISIPILMVTITYLERYFQSSVRFSEKDPLVRSRVIFIALLTAYKYVGERGVLNKAWIRACEGLFNLDEINNMERLFLGVLQYQLMVEDDQTQTCWRDWIEQLVSQDSGCKDCESMSPAGVSSPASSVSRTASSNNNMPSPHSSLERSNSTSKRRFSLPQVATKLYRWKTYWFFKSPV
ncbi:hypothetical protein BC830DRAFT_122564 [Chytriomyces sp. MP71]|nr:hypothetical protein BC830DRAFT_122564 [Chytriomyces sp. MP71]